MPSDLVFLTGASGFLGAHVLRELRAAGYAVRALVRAGTARPGECEAVAGDLTRPADFVQALAGCRYLIHCAALYSFAPRDRARMHAVNVTATAALLEAARLAGTERAVVTSSTATLGPARAGWPASEANHAVDHHASAYHRSKIEQERVALAARLPVVVLNPSAPVGPGDRKPTPTGRMVLEFARGRMIAKPPRGGLNLVPVEAVARAHVSALTSGRAGERYALGGEDLLFDELWEMLAAVSGRRVPRLRAPYLLALAVAYADEARCRLAPGAQPFAPLEGVRMSRERMFVDSSKARRELAFAPGPVRAALERSVAWFREQQYLQ